MAACSLPHSTALLLTGSKQSPIQCRKFPAFNPPGSYYLKFKHERCLIPLKKNKVIRAVAIPTEPSAADSAEHRKQLCEQYGFRQIAEPLPDTVTLKNIVDTLPKKVFEIDDMKAWKAVLISATSYALGLYMTSKAPWYLLPLAWAWTGTAVTGFFVIGHDCAHKSFSKNKLVEDVVGTLSHLPMLYPYEAWRFKHEKHHAKTNIWFIMFILKQLSTISYNVEKLQSENFTMHLDYTYILRQFRLTEDNAWQPVTREELDYHPIVKRGYVLGYGPLRCWGSIVHWWLKHFDLSTFRSNEVERVKISLACVISFMAIGWPLIIYHAGIAGWINYWFMPWLGFHFWMSTFTMIHHTSPHIPFKSSDEWNAAQAQLNGTIHCDYPRWIEILCHDINVHIPHHISSKIPSYNLRAAHQSIQENWGKHTNMAKWNWRLMKTIMTQCHLYEGRKYVTFDESYPEVAHPIALLRKLMPNYA